MAKYKVQRKSDRRILKSGLTRTKADSIVIELSKQFPDDDFWVVAHG